MSDHRKAGFTLIELMVAVCIVAILLTLTLPSYQRQLRETRRSLGVAELLQVMARQEQFFMDHKRYAATLTDLGCLASPYAIDEQGNAVTALAPDRIYLIELSLQEGAYTLRAAPQLTQAADQLCGTLSIDATGMKRATGGGTVQECW